jgi:hypothetical protein
LSKEDPGWSPDRTGDEKHIDENGARVPQSFCWPGDW